MFEVDVKNVTEEKKGRRGPARVWGSDYQKQHSLNILQLCIVKLMMKFTLINNEDPELSDVTLVCADRQQILVHRAVLSAVSSFFRDLLDNCLHQKTLLYLGNFQYSDLKISMRFCVLGRE